MNQDPMQDYVVRVVHKECAPERRPSLYSSARFSRRAAPESLSKVSREWGQGAAGFSLQNTIFLLFLAQKFLLVISWVEGG